MTTAADVKTETVPCFDCGGGDFETLLAVPVQESGKSWEFSVVECRRCGQTITNPRPTLATLGFFYPQDYTCYQDDIARAKSKPVSGLQRAVLRAKCHVPPQPVDWTTRLLAGLGELLIRRATSRETWLPFTGQGRLLDFGCGAGAYLEKMRAIGWTVEGMDFSPVAAQRVTARTGIPVRVGTFPAPELTSESYDAMTMWHVLEHVPDPISTVREAGRLMAPGGHLLIAVPNFASWARRQFRRAWFPLDVPRHLNHFQPHTLRRVVEAAGLTVCDLHSYGQDGWLRKSIANARQAGQRVSPYLSWKPLTSAAVQWTERTDQADGLMVIARKPAAAAERESSLRRAA